MDPWLILRWGYMLLQKKNKYVWKPPTVYAESPDMIFKISTFDEDIFYILKKERHPFTPLKKKYRIRTKREVLECFFY